MSDEPNAKPLGKLRPVRLREGTRFACFMDGLCCTDLHAIGPLSPKEVRFLRAFADEIITDHPSGGKVFSHRPTDGACYFLGANRGCQLHAQLGPEVKPRVCKQYPYHLVATPTGGRVTTDHACPCRTLGDRPTIALEDLEGTFLDPAGRLRADRRVGERILLAPGEERSFEEYEAIEAPMIEALLAGRPPTEVFGYEPFFGLSEQGWIDVAEELLERLGWRRHDLICARVADTLLQRFGPREIRLTAVSWHDAFDRAEARTSPPEDPEAMLADWLADELWSLKWTYNFTFAHARAELATRAEIARDIARARQKEGARADRAMAEAITCAEVVGFRPEWQRGMAKFVFS